jgi:hypothetical protein
MTADRIAVTTIMPPSGGHIRTATTVGTATTATTGKNQRLQDAEEGPPAGPFLFDCIFIACFRGVVAVHNRTRTLVCERLQSPDDLFVYGAATKLAR